MIIEFDIFKFITQAVLFFTMAFLDKAACGARFIFYFLSPSKRYLDNGFQYP